VTTGCWGTSFIVVVDGGGGGLRKVLRG